ncbi:MULTISPECIES: hypothetical protein [Ramlibacter]|uniref:N-acetyltransferase domain-containing protein n=1 Tax=Ramlibacter aquaticus TaxID=2780094 RepID=A0ABR9SI86_9BURK|nr:MULTISPECIES: hypothetical protein [Ramlibacter]MBE7942057.1 hypothetical protein [Ramlibacter aquaticus]
MPSPTRALLAVLLCAATLPAAALEVWNDTANLSNPEIEAWLQDKLPPAHRDAAAQPGRAVYVSVRSLRAGVHGTGALVCEAQLGLTHQPGPGLRPRAPSAFFPAVDRVATRDEPSPRQLRDCESGALRAAIQAAAQAPLEDFTRNLEATREEGGTAAPDLPADASRARLYLAGLRREGSGAVMQALPDEFLQAYDYRRGSVVVLAQGFVLRQRRVCFASAGLAGRYPDGRNARVPAVAGTVVLDETARGAGLGAAALEACRSRAAAQAVARLLAQRWDEDELFSDYATTREAAVALPDFEAIARAQPSRP